jgi:peptidoglycan/LPS O-acetylase OafA/YrhL
MTIGASAKFNPYVHGARGLFCLMVFIYHVVHSGLPTFEFLSQGIVGQALQTGKFGVELFFGISGIVILPSLRRAPTILVFMLDRYARILPVLWATIIAVSIFGLFSTLHSQPLLVILLNLLALPPFIEVPLVNPAAWSLGYEFLFYAACAIIIASSRVSRLLVAVLLAGSLVFLIYYPRALLMVGGVLIVTNYFSSGVSLRMAKYPSVFLILFLALWRALEVVSGTDYVGYLTPAYLSLANWIALVPFIVLSGFFGTIALLGISRGEGILARVLRSRIMQGLGTISFSFYLWPPLVMAGVKMLMYHAGIVDVVGAGSQLFFFLTALPPSILVAILSYRLLEIRITGGLRKRIDKGGPFGSQLVHTMPAALAREQRTAEQRTVR